jgi:hypothetical protein
MEETRARLAWTDHLLGPSARLDPVVARESAFLQMRLICELVALGCLVAHGDLEATRSTKLRSEWSAGQIMAKLEKLHADFFPRPHVLRTVGPGQWRFDDVSHDYLTKPRFLALYGGAGDVLHRGNLQKFLASKGRLSGRLDDARSQLAALSALLRIHQMGLTNGERFVCLLANGEGQVQTLRAIPSGEV